MSESATLVSHEQDGRGLDAPIGVPVEELQQAMDREVPEPEPAPDPNAAQAKTDATPKLSRGQQRFADLTREREEAKREAAAAKAEKEALAKEIADLKAKVSSAQTPQQHAQATAQLQHAQQQQVQQQTAQKFSFPAFEAWLESHPNGSWNDWDTERLQEFASWNTSQLNLDARIRQSIEADRASRSFHDLIASTHKAGREAYADFDAVWQGGPGAGVITIPQQIDAIIRHPQSHHLQYAILRDRDLATRLAQMGPIEFGMTLASLAPATSGAPPASPGSAGSVVPPAPYQPVASGGKTTSLSSAELAEKGPQDFDMDKSGYREKRRAERGGSRRP